MQTDSMEKVHNRGDGLQPHLGNLKRLTYFVAVVETGSFTDAAERLGITKAVVSQQVARLEKEFHTTLLTRTTRRVQTTDAGRSFYQRCALILKDAAAAFDELSESSEQPVGVLRLTAPVDYGVNVVVPAIAAFIARYPSCKVDAMLSDQRLDLASNNLELAIRAGHLSEPDMQARQIGSAGQFLVAAPEFVAQIGRRDSPRQPEDIASLPFVANTALRNNCRWEFSRAGVAPRSVSVDASVSLDATQAVKEAVRRGLGLSVLPDFAVVEDLAAGRLVHVLPEWNLPRSPMHAMFPSARFRPVKVRAFVDLLMDFARQSEMAVERVASTAGSASRRK
jgi:DNA-binding transcriptional LysR family regulator